jgi:hypothetical protein
VRIRPITVLVILSRFWSFVSRRWWSWWCRWADNPI